MKNVCIVGAGSGSKEHLSIEAIKIIKEATIVFAFDRISKLFRDFNDNIIVVNLSNLIAEINSCNATRMVVLLSGDINFYSAAKYIQNNLDSKIKTNLIPGLASFQLLCAKIKKSYENMKLISLHGLESEIKMRVASNEYTFILLDSKHNVNWVLEETKSITGLKYYIGENLGLENETISQGNYKMLVQQKYDNLAVMIIENKDIVDYQRTLYDSDFIRDKVPMTKQEIRWIALSLLDLKDDDIVYDIGAGTGSIAIAIGYKLMYGKVYAIEKELNAFQLIKDNIKFLNAYNVYPHHCNALEIIENLNKPTKVFIGGSSNELENIVKVLHKRNPRLIYVITCITLETQSKAIQIFKDLNINYEMYSINSARAKKVGNYNMMCANNPITIIKGGGIIE